MEHILDEIIQERLRQTKKWGVQNHEIPVWCTILGEEVGEVNKAAWEYYESGMNGEKPSIKKIVELRNELIQVAAVAVQMVEFLDRTNSYTEWIKK